VKLYSLAVNR